MTEEEKRLYIGGLFNGVTESEISERFAKFGDVKEVDIKVRHPDNGKNLLSNVLNIFHQSSR